LEKKQTMGHTPSSTLTNTVPTEQPQARPSLPEEAMHSYMPPYQDRWQQLPYQPTEQPYYQPAYGPPSPPAIDLSRGGWLTFYRVCLVSMIVGGSAAAPDLDKHVHSAAGFVAYVCLFFIVPIIVWNKLRSDQANVLDWIKWYHLAKFTLIMLAAIKETLPANIAALQAAESIGWLIYFTVSKRVRLTFGRNLFPGLFSTAEDLVQ
jgi:hypothetical protein